MLHKYDYPMLHENVDRVDTLRYSWQKLQAQAVDVASHLLKIQPGFKKELTSSVKTFHSDCKYFYSEYGTVGCHFCQSGGL